MAGLLLCKPWCRDVRTKANSPVPLDTCPHGVTAERGLGTTKRGREEGSEAKRCEDRAHPWGCWLDTS